MAQVTEDMCRHIIDAADRKERFPLTINELRQLAYLSLTALASSHPDTGGDVERFESLARAVMADHTYHDTLTARVAELEAALARATVAVQEEQ